MAKRLSLSVLLGGGLLLLAGSAGADRGKQSPSAGATAHAYAIRVVVPGQAGAQTHSVSAPPYHVAFGESFAYPSDGSIATTGQLTASAQSDVGPTATATASGEAHGVSMFGGEITADLVDGHAVASTRGKTAGGSLSSSTVAGLTVLGQAAAVSANGRIALADWGYLTTLEEGLDRTAGPGGAQAFHGFVTALDVHLTAAHNGVPAGTEIQVGYAEVNVQAPAPKQHKPVPPSTKRGKKTPKAPEPKRNSKGGNDGGAPLLPIPAGLHPKLTAGGYVFPVYGPVSFIDTFGAFRGDVPGNWHHGDDIFAPLGAPILACADGIVFSIGWNDVGGNRLWLRDAQGNEFYYAHLSAFSPLAKNGRRVKAGEVLGFVGNTGDAPPLRDPPGLADLHGLRRRGRSHDVPARLEALAGRALPERRRLGAGGRGLGSGAEARRDPAPGLGHLRGERPRSRFAAARDRTAGPGLERSGAAQVPRLPPARQRGLGSRLTPSYAPLPDP